MNAKELAAVKHALEALKGLYAIVEIAQEDIDVRFAWAEMPDAKEAITALQSIIQEAAQPAPVQEPVGRYYWESVADGIVMALPSETTPHFNVDDFPLYMHPAPAAPVQEPVTLNRAGVQKLLGQSGYDNANPEEMAAFISGIRHREAEMLDTPPAAPVQEPNEADELLRHLGLDPQTYRTDGGAINRMKVKAALAHPDEYPRMGSMDAMVNRFLTWPVPASVYPDGTPGQPGRTGTNLLTADEARQMLEHVVGTPPAAQRQWVGLTREEILNLGAGIVDFEYAAAIEAKLREKNGGAA